jgi:two-component system response regulator FlrC
MQRALILSDGAEIDAEHLHFEAVDGVEVMAPAPVAEGRSRLESDLRSVEEQRILDALRDGKGSRKHAAEVLGISPRTLRYKLARLRDAGVAVP